MTQLTWKPVVYLPANLTVRLDAEVLQAADPRPWCENRAGEILGARAKRRHVHRLVTALLQYAETLKSLKKRGLPDTAAMFFWPDFTSPRGTAEVYVVGDDHADGPLTLAKARELTAPTKNSLGRAETSETEVPAGPALRVHRSQALWGRMSPANVGEEVTWFIWPPASTAAVVMTVSWSERLFSEAGVKIADDMARNFRAEPLP